ncbi:hypothetical protein DH09_01000 (plasmid) [Bacillaceae bacterium JMAK1]|nr:hypothetical protein DH09_01000 [Bacillaceae bacterium JMAK1]
MVAPKYHSKTREVRVLFLMNLLRRCVFFTALIIMITTLHSPSVQAHSYVTSSTPEDGETIEQPIEIIDLTFDAGIEPSSTITIQDADGTDYEISELNIEETEITVELSDILFTGDYTLEWEALGVDGHITEGTIQFQVDAEEPEVDEEETREVSTTEDDGWADDAQHVMQETTDDLEEVDASSSEEIQNNNGTIIGLVIGGIVIALIGSIVALLVSRNRG